MHLQIALAINDDIVYLMNESWRIIIQILDVGSQMHELEYHPSRTVRLLCAAVFTLAPHQASLKC